MLVNVKLSGANAVRAVAVELFWPTLEALGTTLESATPGLPEPNWIWSWFLERNLVANLFWVLRSFNK